MHTHIYIYTYIHTCMHAHIHTHTYIYIYIYCMFTYTYTHSYIYIYIDIYLYIHIYIHQSRGKHKGVPWAHYIICVVPSIKNISARIANQRIKFPRAPLGLSGEVQEGKKRKKHPVCVHLFTARIPKAAGARSRPADQRMLCHVDQRLGQTIGHISRVCTQERSHQRYFAFQRNM